MLPHGKVKRQRERERGRERDQVREKETGRLARKIKEERKVEGYRDRSS